jgi:crossover junction endodeoxyribonuclease RusA
VGVVIAITLPWPPSVNTYWRHPSKGALAGRTLVSERGRAYREAVQKLAQAEKWGSMIGDARLSVQIEAYMPDKRRRDLDNTLKAALDSLTAAGVWADDSQIDHLSIRRASTIGGMLKVRITEVIA